jgi:hypothetical protein
MQVSSNLNVYFSVTREIRAFRDADDSCQWGLTHAPQALGSLPHFHEQGQLVHLVGMFLEGPFHKKPGTLSSSQCMPGTMRANRCMVNLRNVCPLILPAMHIVGAKSPLSCKPYRSSLASSPCACPRALHHVVIVPTDLLGGRHPVLRLGRLCEEDMFALFVEGVLRRQVLRVVWTLSSISCQTARQHALILAGCASPYSTILLIYSPQSDRPSAWEA